MPRLLAVLTLESGPTYVDKISHAPSRDLALLYIEEALRDADALRRAGAAGFELAAAYQEFSKINWEYLRIEIDAVKEVGSAKELREVLAYISAKALAIAQRIRATSEKGEKEGGEEKKESGSQEVSSG